MCVHFILCSVKNRQSSGGLALLLIVAWHLAAGSSVWAQETDPAWQAKKWAAICDRWQQWDADAVKWPTEHDVSISGHMFDLVDKSKTIDRFSVTGNFSSQGRLLDYDSASMGRELLGVNPRYVFAVKPVDLDGVAGKWVVSGLSRNVADAPMVQKLDKLWGANRGVWHPNQFPAFTLTVLSDPKWFRLSSLKVLPDANLMAEFVLDRITSADSPQNYVKNIRKGRIELTDESFDCLKLEFDLDIEGKPGRAVFEQELEKVGDIILASKRKMTECTDLQTGAGVELDLDCTISAVPLAIERCFLPFYGLEEPDWARPFNWSRFLMFAVVLGGSLWGLWFLRRRAGSRR